MTHDGSTFHTNSLHILPCYPKEPLIFLYIRQILSTQILNLTKKAFLNLLIERTPLKLFLKIKTFLTLHQNTRSFLVPKLQSTLSIQIFT